MEKATVIKKKICLLGSFAVGKTSLVERFVFDRFEEKYLTTIGVKVCQKLLSPVQDRRRGRWVQHTFLIWDIASLEKFNRVTMNYFRGAAGALAVADLTRPETIEDLQKYCENFLSVNTDALLVIIGNKSDVFEHDEKTIANLQKMAVRYSTEALLSSAKTGQQVDRAFSTLSKKLGSLS